MRKPHLSLSCGKWRREHGQGTFEGNMQMLHAVHRGANCCSCVSRLRAVHATSSQPFSNRAAKHPTARTRLPSPTPPRLLAQVEVAVGNQQAVQGAGQCRGARRVGRRHVAAAVKVAKVLCVRVRGGRCNRWEGSRRGSAASAGATATATHQCRSDITTPQRSHLMRRLAIAAGESVGEDLGAHAVDGAHVVAAGAGR